jgi:hypothetical protein
MDGLDLLIADHNRGRGLFARFREVQWVAKVTVLMENFEYYAEEEETELFSRVRSATDAATRKDWGPRLEVMEVERGAPTPTETTELATKELRQRASQQQIPGHSTMTRDDLGATIDPR